MGLGYSFLFLDYAILLESIGMIFNYKNFFSFYSLKIWSIIKNLWPSVPVKTNPSDFLKESPGEKMK